MLTALFGLFLLGGSHAKASVAITSPADGTTVQSPVQLNASIRGTRARLATMLVFDNNTLLLQQQSVSSLQTSLTLLPGSHTITVVAQTNYRLSASTSITITVPQPGSTPSAPTPTPAPSPSIAAQIANDMLGKNEGFPHGVPLGYDFATGPVMEMGNNASGWKAITAWGVLYEAAEGNLATNTRVNIRHMQAYMLQKSSGHWQLLQSTNTPVGGAYYENFADDFSKQADIRQEPDGTISATAGGGFNFHFYPSDRASINPDDIGGIVVVLEAKLIIGDPSRPDDRNIAHYLCSSGADYYPALTGGWPGNSSANPGVAIGKMKYVQNDWRSFAMSTLTESQLASNPPPINLSGILP